jgi:DnaJ-class molecular chaperone
MLASLARHQPHSYADIDKRSHHLKSLQPAVIRRGVRAFAAATARAATLYELLGVKPSSSLEDIKTGYRKAVIQLHPDVNPGAEAQFKVT